MTNKTSTKRALFTSVMAMFLCFTMLLGTTFAWFTDSAASANNIIVAGNLDVEFYWSTDAISWTEINENTNVFSSELWEPGHTEVVYLKVENKGTLALKYQLGVNVASETAGINESDEQFKLSSYIMYDVIETDVAFADRDAARQAVTNGKLIANSYSKAAELKTTNESDIVALVVYMPETVGNDVNYKTGTTAPTLSLGLNVLATQLAYENDSFGNQYDAEAPLLTWNGDIDTTWYVAGKTEYVLDTPAKLAGLAELVNSGNSFSGVTFKLGTDINLDNIAWTPIGIKDANFNGSFNGNGYTIYNLKVSGTEGVGFIGIAGNAAHIENVHIVSANVVGTHYVGTVLGYGYLAANCLKFCDVEDAIVIANDDGKGNGDKVGAVAGWTANGNIIGNTATDCTVLGCRDIGGIVGYVNGENRAVEVSGNTVENVTLSVINVANYAEPEKFGTNVMSVVGRAGSRVEVQTDNTAVDTSVKSAVVAANEDLQDAVKTGGEVVVLAGNYTFPGSSIIKDTVLICTPDTVFEGTSKLNINGSTVVGATFSNPTGAAADQRINGIFKDCTFTGINGLRWCYAGETVIFENCVFDGSTYGIHFDGGANEVIFKNCTISGFNAMGGAIELATFEGCTFKPGRSSYNGINMWGNTKMEDCTFVFDGTKTEWVDLCGDNKIVTFTNCVVTDGTTEKGIETVVGDYGAGNTIIIDGVYYVANADQFRNVAENATGDVEILLGSSITLGDDTTQKEMGAYFPNATEVTIDGNDNTLTLKGPMPGNDWQAQYYAGIIAPNAAVTVKDLTIVNEKLDKNDSNISADRESVYTMVRGTSVLFENVNFVGGVQVVNNTKFVGCNFVENVLIANEAGYATNGKFCVFIDFEYNADGVCTVDFEGCAFDASGYGCVKVAGDKGANITVNVKDCSFANTCPSNSWSQTTPKYDVKMTGENITVNDLDGNTWSKGFGKG